MVSELHMLAGIAVGRGSSPSRMRLATINLLTNNPSQITMHVMYQLNNFLITKQLFCFQRVHKYYKRLPYLMVRMQGNLFKEAVAEMMENI